MPEDPLKTLSDWASEAHAKIQRAHETINPFIGVRRGLRDSGIPADIMTIDCLRTRKRILLILHDAEPGMLLYQFGTLDEEGGNQLQRVDLSQMGVATLFDWMQSYFSRQSSEL